MYQIRKFPSLYGSPRYTNYWIISRLIAIWYYISLDTAEVRIKNIDTGHTTIW